MVAETGSGVGRNVLTAMKVLSHPAGDDEDDVRLLADQLGLSTSAQILPVAAEVYGDLLDVAARFFVEQLLPPD
jgi:hypothetical protein